MYKFKQDLAMTYFPDNSKETASKRFAHEIHSNKPLLAALQATDNPERKLSTAELNQMERRTPAPAKSSPQNKSKSPSPSSANPKQIPLPLTQPRARPPGLALNYLYHHHDILHHHLQHPYLHLFQSYHFHHQNEY